MIVYAKQHGEGPRRGEITPPPLVRNLEADIAETMGGGNWGLSFGFCFSEGLGLEKSQAVVAFLLVVLWCCSGGSAQLLDVPARGAVFAHLIV